MYIAFGLLNIMDILYMIKLIYVAYVFSLTDENRQKWRSTYFTTLSYDKDKETFKN